ncbi:MAG: carbon-nitrogen hydrolase family protein [Candidatus Limnocylindria bacterium]
MTLAVSVAQTAPSVGDVAANLAEAERIIGEETGRADVVVFPELFTTGYRRDGMDHAALAEALPIGESVVRLGRAAAGAGLIVIGTILEAAAGRVYDTAIVIGADGRLIGTYRKSHLYPGERPHFAAGDRLQVVDGGVARIGLAICFEHAFPEIFTELALRGADLIVIPSAVPVGFEYLLELRTRARAQDNQVFVAASNLVGFDGVTSWCGTSMIVDPRGDVLVAAGTTSPAVIRALLEPAAVAAERSQEPVLVNRRPDLYSHLAAQTDR